MEGATRIWIKGEAKRITDTNVVVDVGVPLIILLGVIILNVIPTTSFYSSPTVE